MKLNLKFSKKFFLKNLEFRSLISYLMMVEKNFSKKYDVDEETYVIEVKIWKKLKKKD